LQTFLPYPDFIESAACLDRQRLGKQRIEAYQILRSILGETKGWRNHPVTRMWEDHPRALATYGYVICQGWRDRGYQDTMLKRFNQWLLVLNG
jgi:hypothetical protein